MRPPGIGLSGDGAYQAIPPTTSVIDVIQAEAYDPQTGIVPVGGIAYAGARGISKVEVQVDDGPWAAAELRTPPLSPLTWVQWRYQWKSQIGNHTFRVRAYDGTGQIQTDAAAPPSPYGATGIHTETALISEGDETVIKRLTRTRSGVSVRKGVGALAISFDAQAAAIPAPKSVRFCRNRRRFIFSTSIYFTVHNPAFSNGYPLVSKLWSILARNTFLIRTA